MFAHVSKIEKLVAELNAKAFDAKRLQSEINKIQEELNEANTKYAVEHAARDNLKKKLSDAENENSRLLKAMDEKNVDWNKALQEQQELANRVKYFETEFEDAKKCSLNLEVEKNLAVDRNTSLLTILCDSEQRAKEQGKEHDQAMQDLQDEIRQMSPVYERSDSAMSLWALDITLQSAFTIEAFPRDIDVASPQSRSKSCASAYRDESMLDFRRAPYEINGEVTPVIQMDPGVSSVPMLNPNKTFDAETTDVSMEDDGPPQSSVLEPGNKTPSPTTSVQDWKESSLLASGVQCDTSTRHISLL